MARLFARRVVRVALFLLSIVLACYLGICAIVWRNYRSALFPAPPERAEVTLAGATMRVLRADDGVTVHALHLPAPAGARTVVYFHGNSDTIGQSRPLATDLRTRGLGVMLVEYRGYGVSRGAKPTEEGLYLDAKAALDALAADGLGPDRIVLWGTSLGTGVATEMAKQGRGARLVLVSPYTSIPELGARYVPWVPASIIVRDRFDNLGKAPEIHLPTLIVHGDRDEVVPFDMGCQLRGAFPDSRLHIVRDGHHNDLFQLEPTSLMDIIAAFAGARGG